ncbi:MAG: hypothetical protein EPN23_07705 [Verrucomicrobia bacterium]|nr:MAG: hypothetical protein EPN23_07705 [Verrucomicrobiota bacterium]
MNTPDFQGLEKSRSPHWRRHLARQVLGWTLIVVGIIDLPLPGPGWLIIGMGAIVLAPYVKIFHRFVEWIKWKFPAVRASLERFEAKHGRGQPPS